MRFGLIGFGAWGRHHAEAIAMAPGAVLAAIAARGDASAQAAHAAYPGATIHRDWRELLADASIDAVAIVVPNHLHATIAIAALDAGKDVLLEKPMASSIAECDSIVAAVRRSGRILSVGHEFRCSEQWGGIRRLISAGDIGEPLYANISLFRFPYRPGSGAWRHDRQAVGSWILEEPVHFFDMAMWWFEDLGDPVGVHGFGTGRGAGLYENFSAILRWPGGAYAVVTQSLSGFEHHHVVEVVGSKGAVRTWWSGTMDRTLTPSHELKIKRQGQSECTVVDVGLSGEVFDLRAQAALTVQAFRERRPLVSAEEARKRIVVCLEAERAVTQRREVSLAFGSHAPPTALAG